MNKKFYDNSFSTIMQSDEPTAAASIKGSPDYPTLSGQAYFYDVPFGGVIINVEIWGLPDANCSPAITNTNSASNKTFSEKLLYSCFYGMHIHENGDCTPPFDRTGTHYNPENTAHPFHAGDMPPLLGNNGYAWMTFYDKRFHLKDILGKSIVIHRMRDDFTSQPAGGSGDKIGCGVIHSL